MADYFFLNPRPAVANRPLIHGFKESNSMSFKAGQLVYHDGTGVAAAASDSWGTTDLMGIAMLDATNVTSGNIEIPIYPIFPGDIWIMYLTSGGTATASTSFTQGTRYGLYVGSNICSLDNAETTTDLAFYIEPLDATNHPYRGKVLFIPATLYFDTGTGD